MSVNAPKTKTALPLLLIAALLTAALVVPRLLHGSAPMPDALKSNASLDAALDQSERAGLPVLALITSDTCPACDRLKRTALADERVTALIAERFVPVVINESRNPDDARRLPYMYLPTTLVIRDGEVAASLVGAKPADDYLAWLRDAARTDPTSVHATAAP